VLKSVLPYGLVLSAALLAPKLSQSQAGRAQASANPCDTRGCVGEKWMSEMRERGIKSVGVEAKFTWNGKVESVVITNLSYFSSVVTMTSGSGSRLMDTPPDSDAFSKMLADTARPLIPQEIERAIPSELAKMRLTRARGSIMLILSDDPCVSVWSVLQDNLVDPDITPLMNAASRNRPSFYAHLESGADVNAHDQNGLTALMVASFSGNVEGVEALLKHRARVNERDIDGRTALHHAAENRQAEDVVAALLKAGANVDLRSGPTAKYLPGATALIIAASVGNPRVVKLLLDAGADPNVLTLSRMTALDLARHPPILSRPEYAEVLKLLEHASNEETNPTRK